MMNVIVYADQSQIDYLKPILADIGAEVLPGTEDRTIQELLNIFSGALKVDLAIVDPEEKEAERIFTSLEQTDIPVVVLVNGERADWRKLSYLKAYGYLHPGAEAVLSLQLKALLRRIAPIRTMIN
jgi:hypothetical protein